MSERWRVHCGKAEQVLTLFPDCCFDSMVTDPPSGISFMNKKWDSDHGGRDKWIEWLAGILREAFRVLKPGAHALVWALPRTSHWTATAVENAGFEIRDIISHQFGSGFPKSLDVSKAIDGAAGVEREVVGRKGGRSATPKQDFRGGKHHAGAEMKTAMFDDITAPATDAAKQWSGWGTALKPSHESWILARKPLIGTVAQNVIEHGTGGLNIDECRVGFQSESDRLAALPASLPNASDSIGAFKTRDRRNESPEDKQHTAGRWPPNTLLSHSATCADECAADCPIAELGRQSGERLGMSGGGSGDRDCSIFGVGGITKPETVRSDTGTAARFFPNFRPDPPEFPFLYSAKPSSAERDAGLDTFQALSGGEATDRVDDSPGTQSPRAGAGRTGGRRNGHATVKGTELMRWLCRLITPPGGTVLDPFAGSGSTGIACSLEGFSFHGIELDPYHTDIARARIAHVAGGKWQPLTEKAQVEQPRQQKLFGGI